MNAPTSTKSQIDVIFQKRADTIREKYDVDMTWSKTATVFDTVLWKKTGARKASATALKAIGAVPSPDSLANIARLNPHSKQAKAPPDIALGENASITINFIVSGK